MVALACAGCTESVCDRAFDHESQCLDVTTPTGMHPTVNCGGAIECSANCVNAASCEVLQQKDVKGYKALQACIEQCNKSGGG